MFAIHCSDDKSNHYKEFTSKDQIVYFHMHELSVSLSQHFKIRAFAFKTSKLHYVKKTSKDKFL